MKVLVYTLQLSLCVLAHTESRLSTECDIPGQALFNQYDIPNQALPNFLDSAFIVHMFPSSCKNPSPVPALITGPRTTLKGEDRYGAQIDLSVPHYCQPASK